MCSIGIAGLLVLFHSCLLFSATNGFDHSLEYIKTRTCVHQMKEFQLCMNKYFERIGGQNRDYQNVRNTDSKAMCCAFWDLFECIKDPADGYCHVPYRDLGMHLTTYNPALHSPQLCRDYPKGSWKCRFPVWLILLIVIVAVALLTITVLLFICIRNFR